MRHQYRLDHVYDFLNSIARAQMSYLFKLLSRDDPCVNGEPVWVIIQKGVIDLGVQCRRIFCINLCQLQIGHFMFPIGEFIVVRVEQTVIVYCFAMLAIRLVHSRIMQRSFAICLL